MTSPDSRDKTEPAATGGVRGRLMWMGSGAIALVMVLAFAAALGAFARVPVVGRLFPASAPAYWQLYRDPVGLFTVEVPPGWTAQYADEGTATEGSPTGSATLETYDTTLGDPPDGTATFSFAVSYWALPNDFARQWQCQQRQQLNTTIDGLPAEHPGGTVGDPWFLDTYAAHYQINYLWPGGLGFGSRPANWVQPTPIPAATERANEQTFQQILATFTPTPATPIAC